MFEKSGFVPFGVELPKQGIQKFVAKKGQTTIKILSIEEAHFLFAKLHYLDGVGYFHCFGGSCCQACKDAGDKGSTSERAILPIAIYKPVLAGGVELDFAYLPLPEPKYAALCSLHNSVGAVTNYDIIIDCEDEKYQKYTFTPVIAAPPIINNIPDAQAKVAKFITDYQNTIMKTLGKTITEIEFNQLRAQALQKAANNVGVNFQAHPGASQVFSNPAQQVALPQPKPAIATTAVPTQPVVTPPVNIPTQAVVEAAQQVAPAQPVIEATATPVVEQEQPKTEQPVIQEVSEEDWASMLNN